jgi:hypothetical protein
MKNMQSSNGSFILTSISYSNQKRKNDYQQPMMQSTAEIKRTIAKYDYCLPPEEKDFILLKK